MNAKHSLMIAANLVVSKEQVFIGAVVVQGVHFVEHIAQVIQKFFLELPEAHGLLGAAFDTEWVHFVYNLVLFVVLSALVLAYGLHRRDTWRHYPRQYPPVLAFVVGFQAYHMVEHGVKITQHLTVACMSCPGLLGAVVNLAWLHFFINLLVLILVAVAAIGFVVGSTSAAKTGQWDPIPSIGGD
jgi:hypothetical protein